MFFWLGRRRRRESLAAKIPTDKISPAMSWTTAAAGFEIDRTG
ncbi:unnamed protein product [Linum tenue]|nr:unnamed protein product [Linum tenue]